MACSCLAHKIEYSPSADATVTRERLRGFFSASNDDDAEARADDLMLAVAAHESGHVVIGATLKWPAAYVTIGGGMPHCSYEKGASKSLFTSVACSLAGPAAAMIARGNLWSPSWSMMARYVQWARDGEAGDCDFCLAAGDLVGHFSSHSDNDLTATLSGFTRILAAIFSDDEAIGATLTLARRLQELTLLEADEIEQTLSNYDLKGAPDRQLAGVDLKELLPCW